MAKVTAPLFSMTASGTVGKAIVYSVWKGVAYVRSYVVPANPKTAAQVGIRVMWKFLSKSWAAIKATVESGYTAEAAAKSISEFNVFMSNNMEFFRDGMWPSQAVAHAEAASPTTLATLVTPAGAGSCAISGTLTDGTDQWGVVIYRDTAEITAPSRELIIAVIAVDGGTTFEHLDSNLAPGTYHYRAAAITIDGVQGTIKADQTAVIT